MRWRKSQVRYDTISLIGKMMVGELEGKSKICFIVNVIIIIVKKQDSQDIADAQLSCSGSEMRKDWKPCAVVFIDIVG